ncbi:MAG: tetratricopeptide repeat protein [Planctomycetota bacterium]
MKSSAVLVMAMILSAVVSGSFLLIQSAFTTPPPTEANRLPELSSQLDELMRRLDSLERTTERSRSRELPPIASAPSDEAIGERITDWLDRHGDEILARAAVEAAPEAQARTKSIDASEWSVEDALASLAEASSWDEQEEIWRKIRESGHIDEVVALFEERALQASGDADTQAELGFAYIQKLQTLDDGPEKGNWATKADQAFDAALALDETHWNARFTKATSLAFWPPIFGKQAESVKQFEILIDLQETRGDQRQGYAQSYLFLGNLYQQRGELDKARETWRRGLSRFPNDTSLQQQLTAGQDR